MRGRSASILRPVTSTAIRDRIRSKAHCPVVSPRAATRSARAGLAHIQTWFRAQSCAVGQIAGAPALRIDEMTSDAL